MASQPRHGWPNGVVRSKIIDYGRQLDLLKSERGNVVFEVSRRTIVICFSKLSWMTKRSVLPYFKSAHVVRLWSLLKHHHLFVSSWHTSKRRVPQNCNNASAERAFHESCASCLPVKLDSFRSSAREDGCTWTTLFKNERLHLRGSCY